MGTGKTHCSLVVDPALSGPTDWRRGGGGPCTALSPGLRSGGLESKFRQGSGPHDRRVIGWFYLCLGSRRGVCFRDTQLGALIHESSGDPVRLVYGLAS